MELHLSTWPLDPRGYIMSIHHEKYFPLPPVNSFSSSNETPHLALHEMGSIVAMTQVALGRCGGGEILGAIRAVEQLIALHHPNIISYVTCGLALHHNDTSSSTAPNNALYILTEFVPSGSLFDLLKRFPKTVVPAQTPSASSSGRKPNTTSATCCLPYRMVLAYAVDVARGLRYLHTREPPILHGNLTAHNVLLSENGTCKLINFGGGGGSAEAAHGDLHAALAYDLQCFGSLLLDMLCGVPTSPNGKSTGSYSSREGSGEFAEVPQWVNPSLCKVIKDCTCALLTTKALEQRMEMLLAEVTCSAQL